MKVLLTQDVKNLGKKGDVKDVSDGYARNFLFSKKMAQLATPNAVKETEIRLAKEQEEQRIKRAQLTQIAGHLKGKIIVLKYKSRGEKLFAAVSAKDIVEKLREENIEVAEKNIIFANSIKKIGKYEVEIRLADDVAENIILEVKSEG